MSFTLFIFWISFGTLLSTVVHVTGEKFRCNQGLNTKFKPNSDSCSSTFGRQKPKQIATDEVTELPKTVIMTKELTSTIKTEAPQSRCNDSVCLNGGTCFELKGFQEFRCECPSHFTGHRCEQKSLEGTYQIDKTKKQDRYDHISECEEPYKSDFCLNEGVCYFHRYHEASFYSCDCAKHFTGHRCEEKALEGSYGGGMKLRVGRSHHRPKRQISRMFI